MPAIKPKFARTQRDELRKEHQLTKPQLFWLERDLGVIADRVGPHVPMDPVRDELRALHADLAAASKRIERWEKATRPSRKAEALGHLNMTATSSVVPSEMIKTVAAMSEQALADGPNRRRRRHRSSPEAIACIVERLSRPEDEASRASAQVLKPTRTQSRRCPSFYRVACLVYEAVYGAVRKNLGESDIETPDPDASIRKYLAGQTQTRRRPGRPQRGLNGSFSTASKKAA